MTQLRLPVAAELPPSSLSTKLVGSSEELVVDDLRGVDIAEWVACFPLSFGVNAAADDVVFAERERVEIGRLCLDSHAEDKQDFVHRGHVENDPAGAIGVGENRRIGDERLRAENALGFRAPYFRAAVTELERKVAANHGLFRRHMLPRGKSAYPLQHVVAA